MHNKEIIEPDRGLLKAKLGRQTFRLMRYEPSPDLARFVRHYWVVRWDLRGREPHRQEVLQYPCVNLVFEKDKTRIYGINTERSEQILEGKGCVLGILFQPGGFYPYYRQSLDELTDRSIEYREVFRNETDATEYDIIHAENDQVMVARTEQFLRDYMPEEDEQAALAGSMVQGIMDDRNVIKVDDAVSKFHLNKRTMQRLFKRYVGVSPKWVIKRSRIQEAALRAAHGDIPDWAQLVVDLGYFDQAHFVKDFKQLIGRSPDEYVRQVKVKE